MRRKLGQHGTGNTSTIALAAVVAVVVVFVLWLVLHDQGKDDKPNQPGLVTALA